MKMFAKQMVVVAALVSVGSVAWAGVGNFDNLSLSANSYWNGESKWDDAGNPYPPTPAESPYNYDSSFYSGGMGFNNRFSATTYGTEPPYGNYTSWSAFAYSNMTDTTTSGFGNQYSVYTGAADSGSNFGVAYYTSWGGLTPAISFYQELAPTSLKMTNTTYAALSMKDGDWAAAPMAEGDWFKVTITAKDGAGDATGSSIDVTLGEWQNGGSLDIVDEWLTVDLTPLGDSVKTIEFAVSSWDASEGAEAQWPTYFAIDTVVPEPTSMALLGLGGLALLRRRRSR